MATAHNPKDIFFEHEMAVQDEEAERAAERESAHDIDWESLDKITDAMSDMVLQNINEKFQKSIFGKFIKPHFFQNRTGVKSIFEEGVFVYGYCVSTYFTMADIDFSVPNNPFSVIAEEFADYTDLDQFLIVLEMKSIDSDLTRFESYDIRIDIRTSQNSVDSSTLMDLQNMTQLHNAINKNNYPAYCDSLKKKVIYFIFENDRICFNNEIDLEYIVNHYEQTNTIINDYITVEEMEAI